MRRALLALALVASPASAEGLTDGLPRAHDEAGEAMTERLRLLVPAGTPVADLRALLDAEGFGPEGDGAARREGWGVLCRPVWLVRWTAAEGRVVAIEREAGGICL